MNIATDPQTGEELPITELARRYGLSRFTLDYRYQQGIRGEELVTPPSQTRRAGPIEAKRQRVARQRQQFRLTLARFLASPAGRLTTHRLGDYGRAQR